jgi:hypothetical protein
MVGAAVSLALFSGATLAAPNIVNTTQKGSLLVFPDIDHDDSRNTIIRLTNDNTSFIDVKCYYGEFTDDVTGLLGGGGRHRHHRGARFPGQQHH